MAENGEVKIILSADYNGYKNDLNQAKEATKDFAEKTEQDLKFTPKIDGEQTIEEITAIAEKASQEYNKQFATIADDAATTGQKVASALDFDFSNQESIIKFKNNLESVKITAEKTGESVSTDLSKNIEELNKQFRNAKGIEDFERIINNTYGQLDSLKSTLTDNITASGKFQAEYLQSSKSVEEFKEEIINSNAQVKQLESILNRAEAAINNFGNTSKETANAEKTYEETIKSLNITIQERESYIARANEQYGAASRSIEYYAKTESALGTIIDTQKKKIELMLSEIQKSIELHGRDSDEVKQLAKEYNNAQTELMKYTSKLTDASIENVNTEKTVTSLQIAFGNLVAQGITLAINAVKDFISTGIELQSTLQTSNALFNELLRADLGYNAINVIEDYVLNVADAYGYAEANSKKYLSSLVLILGETKATAKETAIMSTELFDAATNWAFFIGQDPENVLKAVESALYGNTRALKQYGISISSGTKDMTESEKVMYRWNQIIDKTSKATGSAAAYQDSYAAQTFKLRQNFDKLSSNLAKKFLPVLTDVLEKTNEYLSENSNALENLGGIISGVLSIVLEVIKVVTKIPPELLILGAGIIAIVGSITKVTTGFAAFRAAMNTTIGQVTAFIAVLAILVFLILSLKEGSDKAAKSISSVGKAATDATNQANKAANSAGKRATGGNIHSNGMSEINENGPEMIVRNGRVFTFLQSGDEILNATRTANLMRSGNSIIPSASIDSIKANEEIVNYEYNDYKKVYIPSIERYEQVTNAFERQRIDIRKI